MPQGGAWNTSAPLTGAVHRPWTPKGRAFQHSKKLKVKAAFLSQNNSFFQSFMSNGRVRLVRYSCLGDCVWSISHCLSSSHIPCREKATLHPVSLTLPTRGSSHFQPQPRWATASLPGAQSQRLRKGHPALLGTLPCLTSIPSTLLWVCACRREWREPEELGWEGDTGGDSRCSVVRWAARGPQPPGQCCSWR